MIKKPNFIILGSTGRNSGKTEFAYRLIQRYAASCPVYGVKVVAIDPNEGNCPRGGKGCGICTSLQGDYEIREELSLQPGKDTSRMLMAGASKVFFLKVNIHALERGVQALLDLIPEGALTVCESNSLRLAIEPGLFLVIRNMDEKRIKESCAEVIHLADKVIPFSQMNWGFGPERVQFYNQRWVMREKATAIVLAGGNSSRMGGQDKSLLPVKGIPLIARIVRQLEGCFDEILIGANQPEKYAFMNLPVIGDEEKNLGPLMGIYSCLKASSSEFNFVTACDIPVMNLAFICGMLHLCADVDIVMPIKSTDRHEPLFAVYKKSVVPMIEQVLHKNGRRIVELLPLAKARFVPFNDQEWYQNLNRVEEFLTYKRDTEARECFREVEGRKLN